MKLHQDQFAIAATLKPSRYQARFQSGRYEGRHDAESAERVRWVTILSDVLRGTNTPMGKLLEEKPSNLQLLGGGRRVSTIRSRVRCIRKFLAWLALQHEINYPDDLTQMTGFLNARLSEPCSRGALKCSHRGFVFMKEIAGVPTANRLTSNPLYTVIFKEILSAALPGRPKKQAPRMLISMIAALEKVVVDSGAYSYFRVFAWWLLLQNWGTLRFSDHRGIIPSGSHPTARLLLGQTHALKNTGS